MAARRSFSPSVSTLLGLILFIALAWLILSVVKGMAGLVLTILLVVLAAVVVWRLVKTGFYRNT